MKTLQAVVSSRDGGTRATLLLLLRRTSTLRPPHSRALLPSPSHRCFAAYAQVPPISLSSSESDDTKRPKEEVQSKEDDASSSNPWRHFHAFSGMDEYMDATLIHYTNKSDSGDVLEKVTRSDPSQPDATQKRTTEDK